MGFCSDGHRECIPAKFEVRSFTRSWDNRRHLKNLGSPWIHRSRSSKVVDFGTNRKCACDFLLVCHSNLGPILHRFGDIIWNYFRDIPTYVITVPEHHRHTDRWTDGQTDGKTTYCGITAHCTASRGKNCFHRNSHRLQFPRKKHCVPTSVECSIIQLPQVLELLSIKCVQIVILTFLGHVTSSVTWTFDFLQAIISYRCSFGTYAVSPRDFQVLRLKCIWVTVLTFLRHVTSSVTSWSFTGCALRTGSNRPAGIQSSRKCTAVSWTARASTQSSWQRVAGTARILSNKYPRGTNSIWVQMSASFVSLSNDIELMVSM